MVTTIVTVRLKNRDTRAMKSQVIADLLAQFPREEEFPLDDEVPVEIAIAEEVKEQ